MKKKQSAPLNVSHRKITVFASGFLILFALLYVLFLVSKSRTFQFFGGLTARVETDKKVVALTFDDAPTEYTETVLKILAEKNVKATFYAIGQAIEQYPQQVKEIVAQGHELGNHSYSHKRMVVKTPSFVQNEVEKTNTLIRQSGYTGEITFRPPNGKKFFWLPLYLRQHDIQTIMWEVEPDTYVAENAERIIEYTLTHTKPGSIILLHPLCNDPCQADREALPVIIDGLRAKGYDFETVSGLMNLK